MVKIYKKRIKIDNEFFPYHVEVSITRLKDCKNWNYELWTQEPSFALQKIATVASRIPLKRK